MVDIHFFLVTRRSLYSQRHKQTPPVFIQKILRGIHACCCVPRHWGRREGKRKHERMSFSWACLALKTAMLLLCLVERGQWRLKPRTCEWDLYFWLPVCVLQKPSQSQRSWSGRDTHNTLSLHRPSAGDRASTYLELDFGAQAGDCSNGHHYYTGTTASVDRLWVCQWESHVYDKEICASCPEVVMNTYLKF